MTAFPTIEAPTVEQHATGFRVRVATPRVSWRFLPSDTVKGWEQTAYEIEGSRISESLETYQVTSNQSVLVPWPSEPLKSRESAQIRVRAYGNSQDVTDWSPRTTVESALLARNDWTVPIASPAPTQPEIPLCSDSWWDCYVCRGGL